MDMRISGSGSIPEGKYEKIKISGTAHLSGNIICKSFASAGSVRGDDIDCTEKFKSSGSASFSSGIRAKCAHIFGSFSATDDITIDDDIHIYGTAKCKSNVNCKDLFASGMLFVGGNLKSESINSSGTIKCDGVISADNIIISTDRTTKIGAINGKNIILRRKRFSLFSARRIEVEESITCEKIALEHVKCPEISGRSVTVGDGCEIGIIRYSESIKISDKSKVERIEKIKTVL